MAQPNALDPNIDACRTPNWSYGAYSLEFENALMQHNPSWSWPPAQSGMETFVLPSAQVRGSRSISSSAHSSRALLDQINNSSDTGDTVDANPLYLSPLEITFEFPITNNQLLWSQVPSSFMNQTPSEWPSPEFPSEQFISEAFKCTYSGCKNGVFTTMCDFKSHLKDHSAEVLRQWQESQPCLCPWAGCKSKAIFKYVRVLQAHLENIHVNPLMCTVRECAHRKPFRSNYDLRRHMRTAHCGRQDAQLFCPYIDCDKDTRSFVRKDKWLSHIRSHHESDRCPLHHCDFGKTSKVSGQLAIVEHIKKFHGNYECGLGSCAGQQSRFAEFELLKHLELHHNVLPKDISAAGNAAKAASDRTIRPSDLQGFEYCKYCVDLASPGANLGQDIMNAAKPHTLCQVPRARRQG